MDIRARSSGKQKGCGLIILAIVGWSIVGAPPLSWAEQPAWQGFRQQRRISGQERLKVLRQEQKEVLRKFLAQLPGIAAQQEDTLIEWFQHYQGQLIEDAQAWQAELPFLRELALDITLPARDKQRRMRDHLRERARAYTHARSISPGQPEGTIVK